MAIERIQPDGLAQSTTYTQVIADGRTIYIAGQTAIDANGNLVSGDITAQATQVFENLKLALQAAGAGFADLVKITVYLTDPRHRDAVAAVRARYLGDALPTSTLLVIAGLARPEFLLEIDAIAVRPG